MMESTSHARRRAKPLTSLGTLLTMETFFKYFFVCSKGFRLCGGDQGAFRSFRNLNRRGVPPLVSVEKGGRTIAATGGYARLSLARLAAQALLSYGGSGGGYVACFG